MDGAGYIWSTYASDTLIVTDPQYMFVLRKLACPCSAIHGVDMLAPRIDPRVLSESLSLASRATHFLR
jgi:hypothetical protein